MESFKKICMGLLRALMWGVLLSLALCILLLGIGTLCSGGGLAGGFEVARSGFLMIGALGILLVAGLILFRRKAQETFDYHSWPGWERQFGPLTIGPVLAVICIVVLLTGIVLDYLRFV